MDSNYSEKDIFLYNKIIARENRAAILPLFELI